MINPLKETFIATLPECNSQQIDFLHQKLSAPLLKASSRSEELIRFVCVLYIHSFADGVVTDLLKACIKQDVNVWKEQIAAVYKRQYTLADLFSIDVEQELQHGLQHYLTVLSHTSLPKRNKMLLSHVGSTTANESMKRYRIKSSELSEFDILRHEMIHAGRSPEVWAVERSKAVNRHLLYLTRCVKAHYHLETFTLTLNL